MSFNNFLKLVDAPLHSQFCLEKYASGFTGKNFPVEEPEFYMAQPIFRKTLDLPKASTNSVANNYLLNRKLNPDQFYYAEEFKKWVNTHKEMFSGDALKHEESRIVIPLYYKKELIGFQGRALGKSDVKYITIMLNENAPKVYHYDEVNLNDPVYVLEGPFDSEFVKNSIAMCGADIDLKKLNISHPVYIYDNEPRNKDILTRMKKVIQHGDSIVIWPDTLNHKDVNLMIMDDIDVNSVIKNNTYYGLQATLKFNFWKKKHL